VVTWRALPCLAGLVLVASCAKIFGVDDPGTPTDGGVGQPCNNSNGNQESCGQGLVCLGGNFYGTGNVCAPTCSADHECAQGQGCLAVNQNNGGGSGSYVYACQPNTSCSNGACNGPGTTCSNGFCRDTCSSGNSGGMQGTCPSDETCVPTCPGCLSGICSPGGGGDGGSAGDAGPTLAPMPTALTDTACAAGSDNKVYVFGGADGARTAKNLVQVYDPVANSWTQLAVMPTARYGLGVALGQSPGIFDLVGGFTAPSSATGATEQFDAFSGTGGSWTSLQSMPTPLGGSAVQGIGTFDVAGGAAGENAAPVTTVQSFQVGIDQWNDMNLPPMEVARKWMGVIGAMGGGMFAMGGFDTSGNPSSVVERFDGNAWSTVRPMPTARAKLAASSAPNTLVAALGGTDGTNVLGNFEEYDQGSNLWTTLPAMPTPREGLCAVFVQNGPTQHFYAIGGDSLNGSVTTVLGVVEAFDFASMTWSR
jgi:hypothetical protein